MESLRATDETLEAARVHPPRHGATMANLVAHHAPRPGPPKDVKETGAFIYGDIRTSPLYASKECVQRWTESASRTRSCSASTRSSSEVTFVVSMQ